MAFAGLSRSLVAVTVTALALALGSLAPAPARASHNPAMTVVADDSFGEGAWAAYRVSLPPDGRIRGEAQPAMENARRSVASAWLLGPDGSLRIAFLTTGYSGMTRERHIQVGGDVVLSERSGGTHGQGGLGIAWEFPAGGEFILLLVATSDAAVGSRLALSTSAGVRLRAKTMDARTFVFAESDFRGTANATVSEPCVLGFAPLCGNAKVLVQQSVSASVRDRFFGDFEANVFDAALVRRYEGPDTSGEVVGSGGIVFTNEDPGSYRFDVDANVGAPLSGLAVWGADVALPAPLVLTDESVEPSTVTVARGWVLELANEGLVPHNVTVDGEGIDVDVPAGESVGLSIDLAPGTYAFRCKLHPELTGRLLVRAV